MSKKALFSILLGIVSSVAVMALMFYFFLFPNPLRIHQANLLKWIPILICMVAMYISGRINKNTSPKLLPALFIPFIIFDLFNFFYFPFVAFLFLVGVCALIVSRKEVPTQYRTLSAFTMMGIFAYFLYAQPLIIEHDGFGQDEQGNLVQATVLWDFTDKTPPTLPHHILSDSLDQDVDLARLEGKTHFISFWATWCAPCIEEMPQLDSLKNAFQHNPDVAFVDISIDDEQEPWASFLAAKNPSGTQLISKNVNETRRVLEISALPLHFVVDEAGGYKAFNSLDTASQALKKSVEQVQN